MEENLKNFLVESNLDWKVNEEEIKTESGIILSGYKAIIREDNSKPLSVMKESYQPYQNEELIELLHRVSNKTGLTLKNGGHFRDGSRVFIQLKSNDLRLGDDKIEGYLTGINSFDGSTSLAFGPSNLTISCMNSFFAAFREIQNKVRHTKNMVVKIDEICVGLEKLVDEESKIFDDIVKLSEIRIGEGDVDKVLRTLFDLDKDVNLKDEEQVSTVTRKRMGTFYIGLDGELKQKGDNLWGLFSGVTKYTTHLMNSSDNLESKMFGIYGNRERQIFRNLVTQ